MNSTERVFSEKLESLSGGARHFVVAFSGGCDSLALLVLCSRVPGLVITPVYVNHNLRAEEELEAEMALNRENCSKLGLELVIRTIGKGKVSDLAHERGGGIEDAARFLRYRKLQAVRSQVKADFILTAHHLQDRLETIAMRLGSGVPFTSLRGIVRRDDKRHLIRPLLDFSRSELEAYLVGSGFSWSTDSTNSDVGYERNRIRNTVLPKLAGVWPDYSRTLLDLESKALVASEKSLPVSGDSIRLDDLRSQDALGRMQSLFSLWNNVFSSKELPMSLLSRVMEAVSRGSDCTIGSNGSLFSVYHGKLYLSDPSMDEAFILWSCALDPETDQRINMPGGLVLESGQLAAERIGGLENYDESKAIRLDSSCFEGRVSLRFASEGDSIRLKDGSKMVGRLLQDMGIPSHLRPRVPVLVDENGICAVFGMVYGGKDRICVKFRTSLAPNPFRIYIVSKG